MPIDSPSTMSDSTAEGGRCQRRAKHENRRDRVQLPKGFIGFPSDGTISPLKLIVSYNPLFQRQRFWRAINFNERVGGATPWAVKHVPWLLFVLPVPGGVRWLLLGRLQG